MRSLRLGGAGLAAFGGLSLVALTWGLYDRRGGDVLIAIGMPGVLLLASLACASIAIGLWRAISPSRHGAGAKAGVNAARRSRR